ncbi:TetR family transcriptional regulator [Streptosporangium sandarakinum]|uniref:TetR/AcrR family transcriptional regulator n=1 Tax=Streptosporangium sandarakinum TaxID=1260955 RepID=UPI0033A74534
MRDAGRAGDAADTAGGAGGAGGVADASAVRRRPGRRPGSADTRGQILAAARQIFAEKGFDRATVRGIARQAGVDPALVHHYFTSKAGMFVAVMDLPLNPEEVVPVLIDGPREEVGERIVRFVLTLTADAEARQPLLAMIRTAMTNDQVAAMVREFFTEELLDRAARGLDIPRIRMEAAFSQMFGLIVMRHVVLLDPLASAGVEELVALFAPTMQRYLGGDPDGD